MDKIKKLISRCKCGIQIQINEHRNDYKTAKQAIEAELDWGDEFELDKDIEKIMIETDTIVRLHFYPDTPIGFYDIWHYDVEAAIDMALKTLNIQGE